MKSEKAKVYIEDKFISEYNDIEHHLVHFGEDGIVLEKGRIGRCRRYADKAVELAEQEAEERHAKELQWLRDKAVEALDYCYYFCQYQGYPCSGTCHAKGKFTRNFIQKLNEQ